jgi:orotidine 5'-phosphate decarboxylase subfamily 2
MTTEAAASTLATDLATRLSQRAAEIDSLLCVGLDPILAHMPDSVAKTPDGVVEFLTAIIEATAEHTLIYKPNLGFFMGLGREGLDVLYRTCEAIPNEIPILLDGKVNDMGVTAEHWAHGLFNELGVDALTIAPYMGEDAIAPYMQDPAKAVFILDKNSNPGSGQFQDQQLQNGLTLYEEVAHRSNEWNETYPATVGLVVGATFPETFRRIREQAPDLWILVPGIGAQGGSLEDSLRAGLNSNAEGILASASRSILYAGNGPGYAAASAREAQEMVRQIRDVRAALAS